MSKEQNKQAYYTQSEEAVLSQLETSLEGLTTQEAQSRLEQYGRNELDEGEKKSLFMKFLDQFKDLMIIILIV
ncbi:cation-transporting P-type ATPase [Streptococcus iniae]